MSVKIYNERKLTDVSGTIFYEGAREGSTPCQKIFQFHFFNFDEFFFIFLCSFISKTSVHTNRALCEKWLKLYNFIFLLCIQ